MTTVHVAPHQAAATSPAPSDVSVEEPRHIRTRSLQKPNLVPFLLALGFALVLSDHFFYGELTFLGWITTIMWSLPIVSTFVGLYGVLRTRQQLSNLEYDHDLQGMPEKLIVLAPTVGRLDTFAGLRRAVWSFARSLPTYFPNVRIDIVVEERRCEAKALILGLAKGVNAKFPNLVRVVEVPGDYQTAKKTRWKARANQFMHELRIKQREADSDTWVLHMDDDTGTWHDTAQSVAQFIRDNPADDPNALHLGQGVLSYPHQNATNKFLWLADAVRPGDDVARFAACTGSGTPIAGAHGELFLIRASIEATIGWDFGPKTNVEDAQFALYFSEKYPGRSGWFAGRCYGATPDTMRDLITQRERWSSGLIRLALNGTIKLRRRLFLGYCMIGWVVGLAQHIGVILLSGFALGNMNTSPAEEWVLLMWGFNMAFTIWTYWEGLKINSRASGWNRPKWRHRLAILPLLPVFSFLEALGGFKGLYKFLRDKIDFVVIGKNA